MLSVNVNSNCSYCELGNYALTHLNENPDLATLWMKWHLSTFEVFLTLVFFFGKKAKDLIKQRTSYREE